jgi:hypothetical protein
VKIVEDHDRFSAGDRARHSDTTGEDETEYERVDTTGNPSTDSLDNRSKMGISHPNEHRFLPLAAPDEISRPAGNRRHHSHVGRHFSAGRGEPRLWVAMPCLVFELGELPARGILDARGAPWTRSTILLLQVLYWGTKPQQYRHDRACSLALTSCRSV